MIIFMILLEGSKMWMREGNVVCMSGDVLGESPVWDDIRNALYWIDIRRGVLHELSDLASAPIDHDFGPEFLTGAVLAQQDALLIGRTHAIAHIGTRPLAACRAARDVVRADFLAPQLRINEIKTDPSGRLWCGAMWDYARGSSGGLYRIETDGHMVCVRENVVIPNSLAFSPDGRWIYFADSATATIERAPFDPESGAIGSWQALVTPSAAPGKPDGLAVDAEGCLWSARFGAGCIVRFKPDGKPDAYVNLPVSQPTSCAFGGHDRKTLFITSATQGLSPEGLAQEPLAGALFAVETEAAGMPVARAAIPGT
jgi:sugar lactone lactonase YvrE